SRVARDLALAVRRILDTVAAVEARTRAADGTGTDVEARWDGSPYLGLSPFEERHAEVFYGRRELITGLLQRLAEQLDLSAPLVMIGASGAGKSSLLRAGLLPQLAAGNLEPGSEGWPRRVFTPTATPLRELAVHLADLAGLDAASVNRSLVDDPGQAALIASQILRTNRATASSDERARARVVMVVDQFEELFTLARERPADQGAERRMFVAALRAMAGTPVGPADSPPGLILLAVRADFLDEIMSFPELRESVQRGPFVVGPMNEAELTAAIAGPAAEAGVTVDPALIDAVLHDLRGRASGSGFDIGVLPVLSQAMLTTWEHRGGDRLTVLEYRRAGGVADAVQTSAEEAYQRLDDQQQATARAVFTHLTVLTADGRLARRRMTLTSLREVCGQDGQVDLVVDVFTRKRLVMASDHGVEIGHDALLSNWSRLTGWLESDRTDRTLHNELTAEADAWHARDRDQSYLYRGEKLVAATSATRRWAADPARYPVLTATETAFLQQSTRAESRRRTTRLGVRSGLAVLLIISLGATVLAIQGQRDARQQQRVATAAALLGRADTVRGNAPQLALMLEIAAHRLHHNQTTTARMLTSLLSPYAGTLVGHQGTVSAVTFSPNGRTVASSGANNRVILWDTATARRVGELRGGARVDALAFSPDGQTLAAGDANGSVSLWQVSEPTQPRLTGTLRDQWTRLSSVVFSPDGRRLAGGDASGQTALWDVADPTRPRRLARLSGHTGWVAAAAFSPNGRTLVTGDSNGTAIIWDVPGARRLGQLVGHTQVVGAVAFSPDGRRVATGGGEAMVLLWDIGDPGRPKRLLSLTGHSRPVRAVQFSPQDGRVITTVAADHTVLQWDVTDLNRPVQSTIVLGGQSNWVNAVAVSPDGQYVATPSTDSTVILWRSGAGSGLGALVRLGGGNGPVGTVRFSGDGRLLAAGSADGTVDLWNMANRAHPLRLAHFGAHTGWVSSVAFSPDNQTLATSGADGNAILWDLTVAGAPRELTRMTDHHGVVTSVAFDRAHDDAVRRQTVATGGQDGTVALWDVTDLAAPRRLGTLRGHVAAVSAVAFSPSRGLLAVASVDGTATLWDVTYPARSDQLGLLTGHTNQVSTLSFGRPALSPPGPGCRALWWRSCTGVAGPPSRPPP
ncbi:hypothetical protein ABZ749_32115, partial [Micromonospora sp. NPDC047753]|uniref:nSTAND1 domain-containing NTPase n=1 Tax=Micromonospora sp. NPDC047753 TaxID=3154817 RepID=UPI003400D4D5